MEIQQIVSLLVSERDRLSRAIEALGGGAKRRGRPQKNASAAPIHDIARPASLPRKLKRKPLTAAQKKAHSERMKAFWAQRRKSAKS